MNSTTIDLQTQVLDASQHRPVLVDFWAPWCGPCKMLGPVLEKLAADPGAAWTLVKINTEEQPDLAEQFEIRGIPNVKLFHHGAVVAEFAGALPEPQVRAWLAEHLPTPKRETMSRARELLRAGRAGEAAALLRPLANANPEDHELGALTGRALVFERPAAAGKLVDGVPAGSAWHDDAAVVTALADALGGLATAGTRLPESPVRDRYIAGLRALQAQNFRAAMDNLVAVLDEKPGYDEGRAKAAGLAVFKHLGLRHPIAEEFYRRFSMAVNV